jgi:hypothetical protein
LVGTIHFNADGLLNSITAKGSVKGQQRELLLTPNFHDSQRGYLSGMLQPPGESLMGRHCEATYYISQLRGNESVAMAPTSSPSTSYVPEEHHGTEGANQCVAWIKSNFGGTFSGVSKKNIPYSQERVVSIGKIQYEPPINEYIIYLQVWDQADWTDRFQERQFKHIGGGWLRCRVDKSNNMLGIDDWMSRYELDEGDNYGDDAHYLIR